MECHFCDKESVGKRNAVIEADVCHDGESWCVQTHRSEVDLCQEHIDLFDTDENEFYHVVYKGE